MKNAYELAENILKSKPDKNIELKSSDSFASIGIVLSTATALGNTIAWWFVPYCWAAKLAEPLMGIEMNGTYAGNCGFSIAIMISILLSILLFLILSYADAKDFSKGR